MATPDDILRRVADLITLSYHDIEAVAAGAEELRTGTLQAIADGSPDAVALARAALRTVDQDVGGD